MTLAATIHRRSACRSPIDSGYQRPASATNRGTTIDKPTPATTTEAANEEADARPIPPLSAREPRPERREPMAALAAETEEG